MTQIGIISDTHGFLDERVFHHFKDCHEVWHAGDVGSVDIITKLEEFKPLRAVYGNIDGGSVRIRCPEHQHFVCEGFNIWITHIAGYPGRYAWPFLQSLRNITAKEKPDLMVCGHSHILKVIKDNQHGMLTLNPGAAGRSGFHQVRTLIRMQLHNKEIKKMEAIELGSRSKLPIGKSQE